MRESLFARLGSCEGLRVLDLFAGTGTLGIEALSRGAEQVVFVERSTRSLAVLRENLRVLDLEGQVRTLRGDVVTTLRRLSRSREDYDLVLLDPPYGAEAAEPVLRGVVDADLLSKRGVVILERSRHHPTAEISGLVVEDERRYGDSVICWLRPSQPVVSLQAALPGEQDSEVE